MNPYLKILTIYMFLLPLGANGQDSHNRCDSIYELIDSVPEYTGGMSGLLKYLQNDLIPILSECNKRDGDLVSSMHLSLIINDQGKVVDVEFQRIEVAKQCKEELRTKLLTMHGWTAGKYKGTPVCSKFNWPISSISWR